jgi:hypothetical protein
MDVRRAILVAPSTACILQTLGRQSEPAIDTELTPEYQRGVWRITLILEQANRKDLSWSRGNAATVTTTNSQMCRR